MAASAFTNIFRIPELRKRLFFSLAMLAVYRLGIFVTTPGVDRQVMQNVVRQGAGFLGMLNFFSGGALEQLSIFALGIMPYVSSSIILQLLTVVIPALEKLQKEGELGRRKITQYTRYGTVVLSAIQGYGIARYLESLTDNSGTAVVAVPGIGFQAMTVVSLAAGTAFIMWMGEQITERGIGNGISLVIFAGIVARVPSAVITTYRQMSAGAGLQPLALAALFGLMLVVVGAGSGGSPSSTRSGWWGGSCTAASPRTCRSR
jgi:preprotein translocase subunit SecY